jgi:hypothetical protein
MKPRDIFGVGVRIIGLILTLVGAFFVLWAAGILITSIVNNTGLSPEAGCYAQFGGAVLLPGLFLLLGARYVVRLAFIFDDDSKPDA